MKIVIGPVHIIIETSPGIAYLKLEIIWVALLIFSCEMVMVFHFSNISTFIVKFFSAYVT